MGYGAVEARIQTLLQGLTSVFAQTAQVTRGDWRVVNAGYDAFAILHPGAVQEGDTYAAGSTEYTWTVNIEVWKRYLDDGTTLTTFETNRDAVIQHLQKYPSLNGLAGIQSVKPMSAGDLIEVYDKDGNGPFFLYQTISIPITELVTVTPAE